MTMHPADLIRRVRQSRGDEPGPATEGYVESRAVDPEGEDDDIPGLGEIDQTRPLEATMMGANPVAPPAIRLRGDTVSLSEKQGSYQGHQLILSDTEIRELRAFLGRVVLRQLDDERKRIEQVSGKEAK